MTEQEQIREWLEEVKKTHPGELERLYIWFSQVMEVQENEPEIKQFRVKIRRRKKNETPTNV